MPQNLAPTIQDHLVLVTQRLLNSGSSRPAEVTFALDDTNPSTAQFCADAFQSHFNTNFQAEFSTSVTIEPPFVSYGHGTRIPTQAIASGAAVAGTYPNAMPPSQVAVLARKYTGLGGRKHRGRTYFPWFIAETDVDNVGHISAGIVTAIQAMLDGFLADLAADNVAMCIPNRNYLAAPNPPPAKYVDSITAGPLVTSYVCEDIVATQRRRLSRS